MGRWWQGFGQFRLGFGDAGFEVGAKGNPWLAAHDAVRHLHVEIDVADVLSYPVEQGAAFDEFFDASHDVDGGSGIAGSEQGVDSFYFVDFFPAGPWFRRYRERFRCFGQAEGLAHAGKGVFAI